MSGTDNDVEIFHRINRLRKKAGIAPTEVASGVISEAKVQVAQTMIDEKEKEYPKEVMEALMKIKENWDAYKKADEEDQPKIMDKVYNYSNHVKDLTGMYKQDLMHGFSLSLRDFCEDIDLEKKEHHIIVQSHIDVMFITYQEKLKRDDSEAAEELKKVLKTAIQKYS